MISIIVPVYNVKEYLEECIESVLKLKVDLEVVMVDDGSTDGSGALCDELCKRDPRLNVVHQTNGGLSAARNTGIRSCKGEYIMFLDSDDFLDREETEAMLSNLSVRPDLLLGLYNNYYQKENRFEKENSPALVQMQGELTVDEFLSRIPADGRSCYMVSVRFICRREFLMENELFFRSGIYHEDEEWTLRLLASANNIFVTGNYFYQYRQARSGSIMASIKEKHIFDTFSIMDGAKQRLGRGDMSETKTDYYKKRMASMYLNNLINCYRVETDRRHEMLNKLKEYKNDCVPNLSGSIGRAARIAILTLGVKNTCRLLSTAYNLKVKSSMYK